MASRSHPSWPIWYQWAFWHLLSCRIWQSVGKAKYCEGQLRVQMLSSEGRRTRLCRRRLVSWGSSRPNFGTIQIVIDGSLSRIRIRITSSHYCRRCNLRSPVWSLVLLVSLQLHVKRSSAMSEDQEHQGLWSVWASTGKAGLNFRLFIAHLLTTTTCDV